MWVWGRGRSVCVCECVYTLWLRWTDVSVLLSNMKFREGRELEHGTYSFLLEHMKNKQNFFLKKLFFFLFASTIK